MATSTIQVPQDIIDAMEDGEISQSQLRRLFEIEAAAIGLTFEESVEGARNNTLPHDPIGSDLRMLLYILDRGEAVASE